MRACEWVYKYVCNYGGKWVALPAIGGHDNRQQYFPEHCGLRRYTAVGIRFSGKNHQLTNWNFMLVQLEPFLVLGRRYIHLLVIEWPLQNENIALCVWCGARV